MEYHVILLFIRLGSQDSSKNNTNCFIFTNVIKLERCKIIIMANVSLHRSPPAMGIVLKKLKKWGYCRILREFNRDLLGN